MSSAGQTRHIYITWPTSPLGVSIKVLSISAWRSVGGPEPRFGRCENEAKYGRRLHAMPPVLTMITEWAIAVSDSGDWSPCRRLGRCAGMRRLISQCEWSVIEPASDMAKEFPGRYGDDSK